jgi:hypothetical protein
MCSILHILSLKNLDIAVFTWQQVISGGWVGTKSLRKGSAIYPIDKVHCHPKIAIPDVFGRDEQAR